VIMAIDFVDEGDARLGIAMRATDNAVPDVRRVNHARRGRLFNQSIGKIGSVEGFLISESDGGTVGPAIDDVVATGDRIENGLVPQLAIEVELIPFVLVDSIQKLVGNVD